MLVAPAPAAAKRCGTVNELTAHKVGCTEARTTVRRWFARDMTDNPIRVNGRAWYCITRPGPVSAVAYPFDCYAQHGRRGTIRGVLPVTP